MSTIDLILLGALKNKPLNAYEMKKIMEERKVKDWVKISSPSIYKNLLSLYNKGFLDGKTVKEGDMPEKKVYSLNERGRIYFIELMKKYSEDPGTIYIEFSAFVTNLQNIDPETGLSMIKELQKSLAEKRDIFNLKIQKKKSYLPYEAIKMLELNYRMYCLFYNWSEELFTEFSEHNIKETSI